MKLHLTAQVPSEGARRVAQWILGLPGGLVAAAADLGIGADRVQRIVAGEIVPGLSVGQRLNSRAGVRARDFQRCPDGGWFDPASGSSPLSQIARGSLPAAACVGASGGLPPARPGAPTSSAVRP